MFFKKTVVFERLFLTVYVSRAPVYICVAKVPGPRSVRANNHDTTQPSCWKLPTSSLFVEGRAADKTHLQGSTAR